MRNTSSVTVGDIVQSAVERMIGIVLMVVMGLVLAPSSALAEDVPNGGVQGVNYPQWGLSFGAGGQWLDFNGVNDALAAVEADYRQEGYDVGPKRLDSGGGFVLSYSLRIQFSARMGLFLEYEAHGEEDIGFKGASASFLYRFGPLGNADFHPFLGVGIGRYSFDIAEWYGDRLSDASGGGYYRLDTINIEGAGMGYVVRGGFDFSTAGRWFGSLYLNYTYVPSVETAGNVPVAASVTANSIAAGLSVTLVFP